MRRIVIVGGGYAGFYTAWKLEKRLRPDEAELVIIDPRPYMTYQPFLPEVAAGSVEARHAAISLRSHLRRTRIIAGGATMVRHADRTVTVRPADGPDFTVDYDVIVVTAGAVTRTLPIPGADEVAIGMKHVEEAVAIRDRVLTAFDRASVLEPGPERRKLLTFAFVGGGFSGVEGFGELLSLATALLKSYPEIRFSELSFHLVEANHRILPEVTDEPGRWVVESLRSRGAHVHLDARVVSAVDGRVELSNGVVFDANLIVWTAGNAAHPVIAKHTDLPTDERGRLIVRPDLRVGTPEEPVPDAWAAGDNAAVPDLASPVPGALTVPNAQHAVRQGKRLAANIAASLHGQPTRDYRHDSLGVVATLGLGRGIFQYQGLVVKGPLAWLMHRGYHVLAIPTWERKIRVLAVWLTAALLGRDIVSLLSVQDPRGAFVAGGVPHAR
ncbi:NAD(P)/FAD-dependent oxidoreductase [Agromyces sp. Marseille-P2726]|uniref:NAD(P)/FAD-dependent oxidoreductase n=1 Tax=Agromyces sp. Marseille-P2726 TaxID=2709132 RepID=UPI0015712F86|nr:NAD(P)/FAD-dependent oxidoreductase [Agromyces sp. Marseille-P2726]